MIDLSNYMAERIRAIMGKIYLNVLSNPREAAFVTRLQQRFAQTERRRAALLAAKAAMPAKTASPPTPAHLPKAPSHRSSGEPSSRRLPT